MEKKQAFVTSTQRSVPLIARSDLHAESVRYEGELCWVVKDPISLNYFRLDDKQYQLLKLADGEISIEQMHSSIMDQFPGYRPKIREIYQQLFDLFEKRLVWSKRPGQAENLLRAGFEKRHKQVLSKIANVMFIKLPGFDPKRILQACDGIGRWVFHPLTMAMTLVLLIFTWSRMIAGFDQVRMEMPSFYDVTNWQSLVVIWLIIGATKMIHEFAHAIACQRAGGECHEIGIAFLIFSPCMYCDVSDSWMLQNKWKRIWIASAGMYIEIVMSAMAFLLWSVTQPGLLHDISFKVFVICSVTTVLFNLNPLLKLDGYYILSDLLEIPNLRQKADQTLGRLMSQLVLGIEESEEESIAAKKRFWFAIYSIAATIYRWSLMFLICFILYSTLKPFHLETVGILLGLFSIAMGLSTSAKKIHQKIKRSKSEMRSFKRPIAFGVVSLLVLAGLMLVPIPWYATAEFRLEPERMSNLFVTTPGRLAKVHVRPGDVVKKGQLIAQLSNIDKEDRYRGLFTARKVQKLELSTQHALGSEAHTKIAQDNLAAIEAELANYEKELQRLYIVAPCGGKIVSSQWKPKPKSTDDGTLDTWNGFAFSQLNTGCHFEAGTHLLSINSSNTFRAVVTIDQINRGEFKVGNQVKLMTDHLPGRVFRGTIRDISVATTTRSEQDQAQPGKLENVEKYEGIVEIETTSKYFYPGMTGHARILVSNRSAVQWAWRYVRSTFNFHM